MPRTSLNVCREDEFYDASNVLRPPTARRQELMDDKQRPKQSSTVECRPALVQPRGRSVPV